MDNMVKMRQGGIRMSVPAHRTAEFAAMGWQAAEAEEPAPAGAPAAKAALAQAAKAAQRGVSKRARKSASTIADK